MCQALRPGSLFANPKVKLTILFVLWYAFNIVFNVYNKAGSLLRTSTRLDVESPSPPRVYVHSNSDKSCGHVRIR
jgi:hypothetical protein